jgi:uncharacterized lipoprotein NlpE involved in copper resistance
MQTYRQKFKKILTLFLFSTIFLAYHSVLAESEAPKAEEPHHQGQNTTDWPGIYNGFLPCTDCMGVKTTLALNKNNSYVLISQYVGKSEREFVEKGKFTWGNESNTIILTPRNASTTQHYFVDKNMLVQLDNNGKRYTGKLADRYILRRTDVVDKPPSHSSH